jgi:hypothetical protein
MKIKYTVFLFIFWLTGANIEALSQVTIALPQPGSQNNAYHTIYRRQVKPDTHYTFALPGQATSIALQAETAQTFSQAYLVSGKDTFLLSEDVHVQEMNPAGRLTANLVIFTKAVSSIDFFSGSLSGEVVFHLLNAGKTQAATRAHRRSQETDNCTRPVTTGQHIWRAGLPAPVQLPEATQVGHIIVHHSATSNSVTDYTAAVRNIYLYHTQVNGWNDIGYHFLVAPDGAIFEGRDGRDSIEDDNVLGAHFCGKNRGTIGICLLGTYTSIAPSQQAIASLVNLAAWKMEKENLNPLSSALHPLNSTGASLLNVLSGHRDGCSTECPGTATYALLPGLRTQVKTRMENCREPLAQPITVYPQPANKEVFVKVGPSQQIRSFSLYDATGKVLPVQAGKIAPSQIHLDTRALAAGIYILHIQLADSTAFTRKMLIL